MDTSEGGIVGLVGGIAPDSTVDYYRKLIAGHRERTGGAYPRILINSIDLDVLIDLVTSGQWDELTDALGSELDRLQQGGARFAAFCSNTPHIIFDRLRERSPLPLVSIVEATADEAARRDSKKVGLFGTGFTMQGGFYDEVFGKCSIEVVVPLEEDRALIHSRYMDELVEGHFLPETQRAFADIARQLVAGQQIDALILGGTELPLLLRDTDVGVPYLDTTQIHVEAILDQLLG